MNFTDAGIPGALVIDPELHRDERGFFARTFCKDELRSHGIEFDCIQCNLSSNAMRGTLRGMHYQTSPHGECKIVSCVAGSIFDVIIDLRESSPTFRRWVGIELSAVNNRMLYIPEGVAHGFLTLENETLVSYLMGARYHAPSGKGVRWDDPAFGVVWPFAPSTISQKDAGYSDLKMAAGSPSV